MTDGHNITHHTSQAISFVVMENDDELFEELITMSMSSPGSMMQYMM